MSFINWYQPYASGKGKGRPRTAYETPERRGEYRSTLSLTSMGRDNAVGIGTRYGLDGQGIESRWRGRFSAPVQTGPRDHLASNTMGTGSFSGQGAALTTHHHLAPRLKKE